MNSFAIGLLHVAMLLNSLGFVMHTISFHWQCNLTQRHIRHTSPDRVRVFIVLNIYAAVWSELMSAHRNNRIIQTNGCFLDFLWIVRMQIFQFFACWYEWIEKSVNDACSKNWIGSKPNHYLNSMNNGPIWFIWTAKNQRIESHSTGQLVIHPTTADREIFNLVYFENYDAIHDREREIER